MRNFPSVNVGCCFEQVCCRSYEEDKVVIAEYIQYSNTNLLAEQFFPGRNKNLTRMRIPQLAKLWEKGYSRKVAENVPPPSYEVVS